MKDVDADIMIANDIGSKYQKNPDRNQILIIDNNKIKSSGWKQKEKIVKLIRKEIEQKLK
jgi:phosphopantothenoylcysteine decarboxylase/phosphopantothenate--cysteine ligase